METTFQSAIIGRDITQECPQTVQSGSYQAPSNVFDSRMVSFVFASILGILFTHERNDPHHRATLEYFQGTTEATYIARGVSCTARLIHGKPLTSIVQMEIS